MKARRILAVMLAAMMLILSACGGSSAPASSEGSNAPAAPASSGSAPAAPAAAVTAQEYDAVAAVSLDFTTMDPVDTSDTLSGGIQRLIMDGMFGFDDNLGQIPLLATGYTANEDATQYVITLRQGVSFSDGTPWDANAAKANLDKLADKTRGLKRTSLLSSIIESVEVTGDYEVTVNLATPFSAFIANLCHPACVMMSPKVLEAGDDVCTSAPVGTGQYLFVEWEHGDHLKLELNPNWWGYEAGIVDKDAGFKTINFKVVTENATRVSMLQAGDADFIWPVPTESYDNVAADPNLTAHSEAGIVVRWLYMNTQKAPLNDVRVRKALALAVNKEAFLQVIYNGHGSVATSILGSAVTGYKGNDPVPFDVEQAKALLAEAGYPNGFTITQYYSNNTTNEKSAQFMQQQFQQIGVTLNLVGEESAMTNERIQNSTKPGAEADVDVYLTGWSPSTGDADWALRPLLCSEMAPPVNYNIAYFN
ncbi:MAG: glutathione ABC transporter substrate-binding protein, partial [Firmicutes bacterium]|nr:glutathione ABC transporter substrate-binding protein [Bacillota bacterium]